MISKLYQTQMDWIISNIKLCQIISNSDGLDYSKYQIISNSDGLDYIKYQIMSNYIKLYQIISNDIKLYQTQMDWIISNDIKLYQTQMDWIISNIKLCQIISNYIK